MATISRRKFIVGAAGAVVLAVGPLNGIRNAQRPAPQTAGPATVVAVATGQRTPAQPSPTAQEAKPTVTAAPPMPQPSPAAQATRPAAAPPTAKPAAPVPAAKPAPPYATPAADCRRSLRGNVLSLTYAGDRNSIKLNSASVGVGVPLMSEGNGEIYMEVRNSGGKARMRHSIPNPEPEKVGDVYFGGVGYQRVPWDPDDSSIWFFNMDRQIGVYNLRHFLCRQ